MVIEASGAFPQIPAPAGVGLPGEISHRDPKSPSLRVLVVDDEPLVLWSITEMLRSRGMAVEEAGTAKEALRRLTMEGRAPDVVMLDLRLPDSEDFGLVSMVRKIAPTTHVILMTAFGTPEVSAEARRLGVFTVIEKPFDLDTLEALLARATE
jgi:DNA-binding NtrC family response regulator